MPICTVTAILMSPRKNCFCVELKLWRNS